MTRPSIGTHGSDGTGPSTLVSVPGDDLAFGAAYHEGEHAESNPSSVVLRSPEPQYPASIPPAPQQYTFAPPDDTIADYAHLFEQASGWDRVSRTINELAKPRLPLRDFWPSLGPLTHSARRDLKKISGPIGKRECSFYFTLRIINNYPYPCRWSGPRK